AYDTLTRSAEERANRTLSEAVEQVGTTAEASIQRRAESLRKTAGDPAVHAALTIRTPTAEAAARRALQELAAPGDSGLPIELWNATGELVVSTAEPVARPPIPEAILRDLLPAGDDNSGSDSARFSTMYPIGNERVVFWGIAPVRNAGRTSGYVAQLLRVGGARDASEALRDLTGEDVTLYVRNWRDDVWTLAPGAPATPPTDRDTSDGRLTYVRDGDRKMAREAAIDGTPWIFVLEEPLSSVYARPRATVTRLALLSVALMALGAALSWFISRSITSPLNSLTVAVEAIAKGDYGRRVTVQGRDEIARLGGAFNQMAAEIAESRRALEERVQDARRAREEAEAANRAKSDFLAVMSHELRTPLNAISGYAQLLEMGIHGPLTEAQLDAIGRINRSGGHLLSLINDVLNFAKIDAGQVEFAVTDVAVDGVIAELETLVAPQVQAKEMAFENVGCNGDLAVRADRDKLRQILLNLVSNAIKFTPEGGKIVVECAGDAETVQIRVRDTGVGIPEDRFRSIFEPFVQAGRALNRPDEGVGLGLAISRDLARAMGGDVTVESVVGRGSVFAVSLPRGTCILDPGTRVSKDGAPHLAD
ncbi:MAG: HAMP domain-containing histidine kinase, partial [Gemmatimonadota bacterium]|nr:HAMP domain-containing histidine kinase [Gemmatimonadota bacterium]